VLQRSPYHSPKPAGQAPSMWIS